MERPDITDIAKRRGFFWQGSLVHNPVAGFYDYGHIGVLFKRRLENIWRSYFLGLNDNFYEIEPSIIMPEEVFRASGHMESFVDPVVRCSKCGKEERADVIVEERLKESFGGLSPEELADIIKRHNIKCKCGGEFREGGEINMMFPVNIGTGKNTRKAFLRPETAQGAYVNFRQMFEVLRRKLPMGLAVIGKAFRNEISPRQGLIRMREFTQAELQVFFDPKTINRHPDFESVRDYKLLVEFSENNRKEILCREMVKRLPEMYVYYMAKVQQFYLDVLEIPPERVKIREVPEEEKAFYNKYHWDVEIMFSELGWKEVAGVHYRTDYDLKRHEKGSGQSMKVSANGSFIPHVIEISMGIDRNIYALLDVFVATEKERVLFRFPRKLSPYDAAVFPLVNKDGLPEIAKEVYNRLASQGFVVFYDDTGSIGRRYRRMDEIGVAACITIDYESKENRDVTLRDRDSMKQVRVKTENLGDVISKYLNGAKLESFGKIIK